jgi:hypothetical protein
VEIAGFPQVLHTRNYGHPDVLFVPLIEEARVAVSFCERLIADGEAREEAAAMSGIQLATGFLKNPSFSLSARGMQEEHYYFLELASGTIRMKSRLYAEVSRRTSMFKVEIVGRIPEGIYAVRTIGDSPATFQFDDEAARHPLFFSTILAEECLDLKVRHERFLRPDMPGRKPEPPEVCLTVDTSNRKVPVILRKKGEREEWELYDGELGARFGVLPAEATEHLQRLIESLSEMLEAVSGGKHAGPAASEFLATAVKDRTKT